MFAPARERALRKKTNPPAARLPRARPFSCGVSYCRVQCGETGQWEKALELLEEMRRAGLRPDQNSYRFAMKVILFCQFLQLLRSLQLVLVLLVLRLLRLWPLQSSSSSSLYLNT